MVIRELKIISDRDNKLVERRELTVEIDHFGSGTPTRNEIREKIAEMLKVPVNLVIVRKLETEYGLNVSTALIHIYSSEERLRKIEPEHVIRKNFGEEKGE